MGKKKVTYNKEESVEFKMMFRHHKDPLYYDTKANPKIFVPITSNLTESQMKVVESFPAEDRGEVLDDDEYKKKGYGAQAEIGQGIDVFSNVTSLVEMDQFEAAAKRHKLREQAAREKKDRKYREQSGQLDFKDSNPNPYDSEEKEYDHAAVTGNEIGEDDNEDIVSNSYDSEFEAEFFGQKDKDLNRKLGNRSFEQQEDDGENSDDDQIDSGSKANKQEKFNIKSFTEDLDVNQDLKKFHAFKPAEGVSYVKYDALGNAIDSEAKPDDKNDIRNYLAKEGDDAGFTYVAPNDDQMAKVLEQLEQSAFVGGRRDVDIKVDKMTQEEKAVFDCLEDEQNVFAGAYEELDDDFLMMLNDGKPALELAKEMKPPPMLESTHENAGVEIIEAEVEHEMMIPNYKEKMADVIAMLDAQKEIRKKMTTEKVDHTEVIAIEKEAIKAVNQNALDEVFASFMQNEYKDEQIGDLEGDEGVDPMAFLEEEEEDLLDYGELSDGDMMSEVRPSQQDLLEEKLVQDNAVINEAVDEFIQDKRLWFRTLHKQHADGLQDDAKEKGQEFLPGTAKFIGRGLIPIQDVMDPQSIEFKKIVLERTLANTAKMQEDMDARPSDYESPDTEEDPEDQWDADTILTTLTNTDNHPGIIKYVRKVKTKSNAIILDKQFKVPIESMNGLIPTAEEIYIKKKAKKVTKAYFLEDGSDEDDIEEEESGKEEEETGPVNPKKEAKKAMKLERKEKRKQKKELKVAFKTTTLRQVKQTTVVDAGNIRPGVSVRKIY